MSDEMLLEELPDDEAYESGTLVPAVTDADAETNLRCLRHWKRELAAVERRAASEQERIKAWLDRKRQSINERIAYHEYSLGDYLTHLGKHKVSLVEGTIFWRSQPMKVEITDEKAFMEWAATHEHCTRITIQPDRKELRKHIQACGEEPPGVEVSHPGDTLSIRFGERDE